MPFARNPRPSIATVPKTSTVHLLASPPILESQLGDWIPPCTNDVIGSALCPLNYLPDAVLAGSGHSYPGKIQRIFEATRQSPPDRAGSAILTRSASAERSKFLDRRSLRAAQVRRVGTY
jgi:hypothetical protein